MFVIMRIVPNRNESLFCGFDFKSNPKWRSMGTEEMNPIVFPTRIDAEDVLESLKSFRYPIDFIFEIKEIGFI